MIKNHKNLLKPQPPKLNKKRHQSTIVEENRDLGMVK
uniref:Uncharacterized protein n=1 Tax=Rhizophora mucronata TaxID=61149 RepID=A0A2P2K7I7_RHIMU